MIIPVYPTSWYWVVGDFSPTALVWEASSGSFISNTNANYLSWIANGGKGTFDFPILNVLGAANNGSGLIRLTVSNTISMLTGDAWVVQSVAGTTEANGTWLVTVIDGTHVDLQGSTFTHAYTSGGVIDRGTLIDTRVSLLTIIQVYNQNLLLNGQQGWASEISTIVANKTLTNPVFKFYDITVNAAGLSVFLPQANLFGSPYVGQPIIIYNNSASGNNLILKTASGTTLVTLLPGNQVLVTAKNSGSLTSTDGAWDFGPYNTGWAALPLHNQVLAGSSSTVGAAQVPVFRTLVVADGATGQSTLTSHAVLLGEGAAAVGFATIGTAGRLLIDQGAGVDPAFMAVSGVITVTSAGVAAFPAPLPINQNATAAPASPIAGVNLYGIDGTPTGYSVDAFGNNAASIMRRANNTNASPTQLVAGDIIGAYGWRGYDGSGVYTGNQALLQVVTSENWVDATHRGTIIRINTTPTASGTLTEAMRVNPSGGISIGTTADPGKGNLVVSSNASTNLPTQPWGGIEIIGTDGVNVGYNADAFGAGIPLFMLRKSNGTNALPTKLTSGTVIGGIVFRGYDGSGAYSTTNQAAVDAFAAEDWNDATHRGAYLSLFTTALATATNVEAVRIQPSGGVSIGNTTDTGAGTLNANGVVITKGYTVATLPSTAATGKVQGARAFVTDALGPAFLAIVAAGGAVVTPVFYNGTNWVCG